MGLIGPTYIIGPTNGGKTMAYNAITSTSNTLVAPINPKRNSITFINPGSQTLYISMTRQVTFSGSGSDPAYVGGTLTPTTAALGGTTPLLPGALWTVAGECGGAWQALAAANSNNPLTVIDSNV